MREPSFRPAPVALLAALFLLAGGCSSAPSAAPASADPAFADLTWLTGAWAGEDDRGVRTEEYWTTARAGTMFGVNRVIAGDRTVFFENLRIERTEDGGLVYLAAPKGRHPATPFRRVPSEADRIVFENPDHDYPQRIVYRREPDGALHQRIEGTENGEPKSGDWRLRRLH
jgi:hypothetical protein